MYDWTEIQRVTTEAAYTTYRSVAMCCSVSYHKEDSGSCSVCGGSHLMVERRVRCTSETCSEGGKCPVVWKARHCTAHDEWVVFVNDQSHGRGALPCFGKHAPRVTKEMKVFIAEQDENDATPRLIETRLKNKAKTPPNGWPTLEQISNALKHIRQQEGTRNTIEGIEAFVATRVYTPDALKTPEKAFVFGPDLDGNGIPSVGSGTDVDPFILGVTSPRLIDLALLYANGGRFTIFHDLQVK